MKQLKSVVIGAVGLVMFSASFAFADSMSASIQAISPSATIFAKNNISFAVQTTGFVAQQYRLVDSFSGSTASLDNINNAGNFSWTPWAGDAGTHDLTITASDYSGDSATVTQTIVVMPPPSIAIQNISPGNKIMPGTPFSFTVVPTGFTNPTYSLSDQYSGSSIGQVTIGSSGNFLWTPTSAENGEHTIEVYASDSLGHNNVARVTVLVGAGPSLAIGTLNPSGSIKPGQTVSFYVNGMNFAPSAFTVADSIGGSTISNGNINSSGLFVWTPSGGDTGVHVLTITGMVGFYGQSASTTQTITVLGPNGEVPPTPTVLGASTVAAASGASVSALQAQLAALNAKITAQSGAITAKPASSPSGLTFTRALYSGMHGDIIATLQTVLTQQGFFSGEASGDFGPLTVAAVKKFQAAHGLASLGVVGPATRDVLNGLSVSAKTQVAAAAAPSGQYVFNNFIGWGDHGTDVLELQKRLISLGFLAADSATGYFGDGTYSAVKAFQAAHGLDQKGHVGPGTRAALNQ